MSNRYGTVAVGELVLWESGAIAEYVMARYGDRGLKPAVGRIEKRPAYEKAITMQ